MDAHKAMIKNIFDGGTLVEVPFFQRSYVWKEDLWQRLLDDIDNVLDFSESSLLKTESDSDV